MAYVIAEPCVSVCDTACVEVCPMDCIHGPLEVDGQGEEVKTLESVQGLQLYINPDECIDCGACEPECPVGAIFYDDDVPEKWSEFIEKNKAFFEEAQFFVKRQDEFATEQTGPQM